MAGSPARKEVGRVGVKVVPDTSDFGRQLKAELARWENEKIKIDVEADFEHLETQLERITSSQYTATIQVEADTAAAEAQIRRAAADRTAHIKVNVDDNALRRLADIGRPVDKDVRVDLDDAVARSRLESLTSDRTVDVKVDLSAAAAEARLKELTRTESKKIRVDVDHSSLDTFQGVIKGIGGAAASVVSGITSAVSSSMEAFGTLGEVAEEAFDGVIDSSNRLTGVLGNVGQAVFGVISGIIQLSTTAIIITSLISLFGSLVTAAGAAAAAIGSVVFGAGGLIALPAIIAGVVYSFMQSSDDLRAEWDQTIGAFTDAFRKTLDPALEKFSELARKAADALEEGNPFFDEWTRAIGEMTEAIGPLASAISKFATETLKGMADAMEALNSSGFWDDISKGFETLGEALGAFFVQLSSWAPQFAQGFQAIADAALKLLPSLADLAGAFASFAPAVIEGIADAFVALFEAFTSNREVYERAAVAFAQALREMAPALEEVFRAFALMAPEVMGALASAVQQFADSVARPEVIDGLISMAEALVTMGTMAAEASAKITDYVGDAYRNTAEFARSLTGTIKRTAEVSDEHLRSLVDNASNTHEAASLLAEQMRAMFSKTVGNVVGQLRKLHKTWDEEISKMVETGNTKAAELNQGFRQRLIGLLITIKNEGMKINDEWVKQMQQLIDETAKSGDPLAQQMSRNMQRLLNVLQVSGPAAEEQVRKMLKGMENQVEASRIAEILGIELDQAANTVDQRSSAIRQSFAAVLQAMPEMIRNAKTPEELDKKLQEMESIVSKHAGPMRQAFTNLGKGMAQGLKSTDVTKAVTSVMNSIKTAITSRVPGVVQAFDRLPKGMADSLSSNTSIVAGIKSQMDKVRQAVSLGVTQSEAEWRRLFTRMDEAARSDKTPQTVKSNMDKIVNHIKTAVSQAISEFKRFTSEAEKAGKLTGFVSGVKSAMNEALGIVRSTVNQIIAELSKLNRTFKGPKIQAPQQEGGSAGTSSVSSSSEPVMVMSTADPVVLQSATATTAAAQQITSSLSGYARQFAESRTVETSGDGGVTKIYNFTVNAAPNVPTEEQLRKQLSYADALYS